MAEHFFTEEEKKKMTILVDIVMPKELPNLLPLPKWHGGLHRIL